MSNNTSDYLKHPYQRIKFWLKDENQFWNNGLHSQKSKDYFNKWLSDWLRQEKSVHKI